MSYGQFAVLGRFRKRYRDIGWLRELDSSPGIEGQCQTVVAQVKITKARQLGPFKIHCSDGVVSQLQA
jgi:hypothetical protein